MSSYRKTMSEAYKSMYLTKNDTLKTKKVIRKRKKRRGSAVARAARGA